MNKCRWLTEDNKCYYYMPDTLRDCVFGEDCTCYEEKVIKQTQEIGFKDDSDKNKLEILMLHFVKTLEGVGQCCTYGAKKYKESVETKNWHSVDNPKYRYIGALFRHLFEYLKGNKIDPESGLPHIHKAIWNLMVLSEFEIEGVI